MSDDLVNARANFLWALINLIFCFTSPESDRVFHYLYVATLFTGSIAYFAQASGYGWISGSDSHHQLYWARYVYWVVSWPEICLSLGLISGLSCVTMLTNIAMSWIWVLSYLAGGFMQTDGHHYKWGAFAFGTLPWLILVASTLNEGREAAERVGIKRDYLTLASWANLIWLLYPIACDLTDLSHVLSLRAGLIFFGTLDFLLVPVMAVGFLALGQKWNFEHLNLAFSEARGNPALRLDGHVAKASGPDKTVARA